VASRSKCSERTIVALEHEEKAVRLRKAGLSYRRIAEAIGMSTQGAYRAVDRAVRKLQTRVAEDTRKMVAIELERLDDMQLGVWQSASKGDTKAIATVLAIMDRRARLTGMDEPAIVNGSDQQDFVVIVPDNGRGPK